jgi:cyclic dehypoxanthinyl futalosine synthase
MRTAAAMIFGRGETCEQRVRHLEMVRRLQETTGGFAAFVPWSYHPDSHAEPSTPEGGDRDQATSVECLKTLAVSRLYLDNIENVQAGEDAQDLKTLQLGLRFGGNDAGSALNPSLVAGIAGYRAGRGSSGEEDLRRVLRDAGFEPVQRDALYTTCFLN